MPLKVRVDEGREFTKTITLEGRQDSESVAALDDPLEAVLASPLKVLLLNPQPPVQKVFDIVKAVDVNEVFRSVAELDAYLDAMQRQVAGGE
jgi:hypothetical protein